MSNQYIIKFSNNVHESVDAFAELSSTTYGILALSVRSCEDKSKSQSYLHQFITNSFGQVQFDDETLEFTLTTSFGIINRIMFDSNSSSAYTEFKKQLTSLVNTKFETEYYPSGRVYYVGEVLYVVGEKTNERVSNRNGIVYYDLPDHKIKYSGQFENGSFDGSGVFYNKNGTITLRANNISNGIPTQKGKLEIIFKSKKEVIDIDFFDSWDNINCYDNKSKVDLVMSDHYLDDLAFSQFDFDDMTQDDVEFISKSTDEKINDIRSLLKTIQTEQELYYSELESITRSGQAYNFIFNFIVFNFMIAVLLILTFYNEN